MYGAEWHGKWGPFQRAGAKVTTAPLDEEPAPGNRDAIRVATRNGILADFHDTLAAVDSGAFLKAVEVEAAKVGAIAPHLARPR
jgi:hypothetical protein